MADVIDVVHKITYEVDDNALAKQFVALDKLISQLNKLQHNTNKTQSAFSQFGKGLLDGFGLGGGIAGVTATATKAMVQFLSKAGEMADAAEATEVAFQRLNNPAILDKLRIAAQGTISDLQLMQYVVDANNLNVPLEHMATALSFARLRAKETGKSVEELTGIILTGVSTRSLPELKKLGLNISTINDGIKQTGSFAASAFSVMHQEVAKAGNTLQTFGDRTDRVKARLEGYELQIGKIYNKLKLYALTYLVEGQYAAPAILAADEMLEEQQQKEAEMHNRRLKLADDYFEKYKKLDARGKKQLYDQASKFYMQTLLAQQEAEAKGQKSLNRDLLDKLGAYRKFFVNVAALVVKPLPVKDDDKTNEELEQDIANNNKILQSTLRGDIDENKRKEIQADNRRKLAIINKRNGIRFNASVKEDPYQKALDTARRNAELQQAEDVVLKQLLAKKGGIEEKYTELYEADKANGTAITLEEKQQREEEYTKAIDAIGLEEARQLNKLEQQQIEKEISIAKRFKKEHDISVLNAKLRELQEQDKKLQHDQGRASAAIKPAEKTEDKNTAQQYTPGKFEKALFGKDADIQNPEERRRAEIKKSIDAYKSLSASAAEAFKAIYDAQVQALDAEIEIRKQRVDAAAKLAEQGNTEALRIEQERLDATLRKREEYAKREQVMNAALALSNAIVAVAEAASQSGAGAVVIVPAVIAAIVAGYAAISAATRESTAQAFADGVVDFKGKGGPRDDANWVRISSGESVITAEGTRNNRQLLEAINSGSKLQFINPALAYTMPVFANPQYSTQGYASAFDLQVVENKLDGVINAIEDNRMKQNIFFNEHGVGIMTERAIRKDRKRWL